MPHASIPLVSQYLRLLRGRYSDPSSDHELLQRFVNHRDESAFAVLVERHAALVLGLCRSILRNHHDAEDIFQAAFLVLARKAGSIRKGESVGSWLYAVAYRLAHKARSRAEKQRRCEQQAALPSEQTPMDEVTWGELRDIVHEEVSRLPEKYRSAVVLCYWQGRTHEQAGQQLGCDRSTIKDRLENARELLRTRLARRGLALSAAWFAASLSEGTAAAVSAELIRTTVRGALLFSTGQLPAGIVSASAAACAREIVRGMFMSKLRYCLVLVLMLGVLGGGAGLAALREAASPSSPEMPPEQTKTAETKRVQEHIARPDDPLPPGAIARLGTLRFRHGERIDDIALAADGKSVISAAGKIVYVWELATGRQRCRLDGFDVKVPSVACSPDGKLFAAGCEDGTIRLWDPAGVREVRRFLAHKGRAGDWRGPSGVSRLLFSPDGKKLVSTGSDYSIRLWNPVNGEQIHHFGPFRSIWGLALSPDGRKLASAVEMEDGWTVRLWEVASGNEQKHLTELGGRPTTVAFSNNGKRLAVGVGGKDWNKPSDIQLWDVTDMKKIRTLTGHQGWVGWLAFSPDGHSLVSTSSTDVTARVWDLQTGAELRHIGPDRQAPLFKMLYCHDGKTLVSYGQENTLRLWDSSTGKEMRTSDGAQSWVGAVSFSPNGRLLASGSADGLIQLWDAVTRKEVRRFTHSGWLVGLPFSPDGQLVASAGMFDPVVRIWETNRGKQARQIKTPAMFITCLAWSGDGKTLATWSRVDRRVHLWDAISGKEQLSLGPIEEWVNSVLFSPDGRTLAVGVAGSSALAGGRAQGNENVLLWTADSGKLLRRLKASAGVNCLAISPDGRTLAGAGMDRSLRLWEIVSGQVLQTLQSKDEIMSLAFSPDGRMLATAKNRTATRLSSDGTTGVAETGKPEPPRLHLWDLEAQKEFPPLEGHQGSITSLAFSPDGKLLATGSNDTTVLLWDATRFKTKRPAEVQLRPEQIDSLWADIDGADAVKAYRAIRTLATAPKASVMLLKKHLRPVKPADAKQAARLIADLDSDEFAVRDKAMKELEKLGDRAATELRKALASKPTLEVKRRIEQLLEKQNGVEQIRMVRALETLERIGTPEARELCAELADGVPDAPLTREARASLRRMKR